MTQKGETDDYAVSDHVKAIHRQAGDKIIDLSLPITATLTRQYSALRGPRSHPVIIDKKEIGETGATLILSDLINKENSATTRYEETGECPL